ncbi:MAG TPA: hypothetical protein DEA97_18150 [Bacteroidales bacterium]|nr:MAG: hypothetical protein UR43_C0009G0007 [candidate division TM6 bacterium GW2011_GWF2_33_332]OFY79211.1 MAG: hypothetical protein A2281_14705 [Bacteroidetes bacterium RIFOXYA12_FULL_38_20]HBS88487.1 hypothetical protein [Bacteroidales bacterium]
MKELKEAIEKILIESNNFIEDKIKLESPIENMFHDQLFKYKGGKVKVVPQYSVKTISGTFRLDFVLESDGSFIGIECDGKEFHKDDWYDEWRDSLLLFSSGLKSIFRFKGKDIYYSIKDLVYIMARKEPTFFNMDMIERISPSINNEIKEIIEGTWDQVKKKFEFTDSSFDDKDILYQIEITWRNLKRSFDTFCYKEVLYSYIFPGKTIEELKNILSEKHYETEQLLKLFNDKYPENKIQNS